MTSRETLVPATRALVGWIVVVPLLSALTSWLVDFDGLSMLFSLLLLILTLGVARALMGSTEYGLLWRLGTALVAIGISVTCILGEQAWAVTTGDLVQARVTDASSAVEMRLEDPATGRDLGVLEGVRRGVGEGDTLPVHVAGDTLVREDRADLFRSALAIWVTCWVLGLAACVLQSFRARRRAPAV